MGDTSKLTYFYNTIKATMTAEQLIADYDELKQWQYVAKKYSMSHSYLIRLRKDLGIFTPTLTKGKNYGHTNSKNNIHNGRRIDKRGYVIIGRYHPDNTRSFSMYEHTLIMEKHINRKLLPNEAIHHIDGNKQNNSIDNLFLCNHSTHRFAEHSAISLIYELYKNNFIGFDKLAGIYYIK